MSSEALIDHPRVRSWLEIRQPLEAQLEPLGRAAMARLRLLPGDRVLDVGCGIGGTPAALAQIVGPLGKVVGLELLDAAVKIARRDPGLSQTVTFECGDAGTYPFQPNVFNAIFSRFGTMFFADQTAAFRNLKRALIPNGRLAFVCWRGLEENELDLLPLSAAAPHLPQELVRQTATAGWFSFSDAGDIRAVLDKAGFHAIEITPHDQWVSTGSLETTVEVCARVGALGAILREHPELRSNAIDALRRCLAERDGPSGPALRAATWLVAANAGS